MKAAVEAWSSIKRLFQPEAMTEEAPEVDGERRTLGVQVMITQGDNVFVRPDPEGKAEGYVHRGGMMVQVSRGRLNGAGGAIRPDESVDAATRREIREELDERLGLGTVTEFSLPRVACYQEVAREGRHWGQLIAVGIVRYEPTTEEVAILSSIEEHRFMKAFDALFLTSFTGFDSPEELGYRPTFRVGLEVIQADNHAAATSFILGYNKRVILGGQHAAREAGIPFYPGHFVDQAHPFWGIGGLYQNWKAAHE